MIPEPVRRAFEAGYNVVPANGDKVPKERWRFRKDGRDWSVDHQTEAEFKNLCNQQVSTWAIITGQQPSGVVVLDFDGAEGLATWRKLGLPTHVTTGGGGKHVYFRAPDWPVKKVARPFPDEFPGLDVQGEKGLAFFAGRSKKGPYRTHPPFPELLKPEDWPEVLKIMERLERTASTADPADFGEYTGPGDGTEKALKILKASCAKIAAAEWGHCNAIFNRETYGVAGLAASGQLDPEFAQARLREAAYECHYADTDMRFEEVFEASWRAGAAEPMTPKQEVGVFDDSDDPYNQPVAKPKARFTPLADIEEEEVDWLWDRRIPVGKLSILCGDPGTGKTFIAMQLAASVTTGAPLPQDDRPREPGSVLFISFEDGPGDTLKPRARRMGADMGRLFVADVEDVPTAKDLPDVLPEWLDEIGDVRLIVLDPLGSFIGGIDTGQDNLVREALAATVALASTHDIAVLILAHLNKDVTKKALQRVIGSMGFLGMVRSALAVGEIDGQRGLACIKNNLSQYPDTLAYDLVDQDGPGTNTGVIEWGSVLDGVDGNALLRGSGSTTGSDSGKEAAAREWLRNALAYGPRPSTELVAQAEEAGHAVRTVNRAKKGAVKVVRQGPGKPTLWRWWDDEEDE